MQISIVEILKAILFGIVEGVTEWLPVSSTGHMILLEEFVKLNVFNDNQEFWDLFLVVIQLGAILAVVILFWKTIWPFKKVKTRSGKTKIIFRQSILILWLKVLVACIPAAVVGILFDDWIDEHFYNPIVVSIMLILVGVLFIIIETVNKNKVPRVDRLRDLTFKDAFLIGLFQLIAAIFPGTSRSGATILGGLMIGVSRAVASKFTFILAIPVMFGASLLKIVKYGFRFSGYELIILGVGMLVAFLVSMVIISFLMNYIRKHDFKVFGVYRIILGALVLLYFLVMKAPVY
ncbi:MAG: undecaprenyl-diphosphate phosphatase [Lachnospiraceae bacterium]|nr:undecaprenyl-diphosphate phosphatase [Lachnospiraceae bacterium]